MLFRSVASVIININFKDMEEEAEPEGEEGSLEGQEEEIRETGDTIEEEAE